VIFQLFHIQNKKNEIKRNERVELKPFEKRNGWNTLSWLAFMERTFDCATSICVRCSQCRSCVDICVCPIVVESEKYECDSFAANNDSRTEIAVRIDGTKLKRGCFERFFGVRSEQRIGFVQNANRPDYSFSFQSYNNNNNNNYNNTNKNRLGSLTDF